MANRNEPPVMHTVASSNVAAIGYDDDEDELWIEFHWGGVYRYFGVSRQRYIAILAAVSKGAYVNRVLSKSFLYERMS